MTWIHLDSGALREGELELDEEHAHYLGRVLRRKVGDTLTVSDGRGRYGEARVVELAGRSAKVEVSAVHQQPKPAGTLEAQVALIKGERMDFCLQKLTELGVDRIQLVAAERNVVRWSRDRETSRMRRFADILRHAAAQSERAWLPELRAPVAVSELGTSDDVSLALVPRDQGAALRRLMTSWSAGARIRFAVGPEGGFTDEEHRALIELGYLGVTLGPFILRAETAATAAAAILALGLGRLD